MEDWEKKFQDLEREVDAEFDRARTSPEPGPEPAPASPSKAGPSRKAAKEPDGDVLGDLKRAAAASALQKAAETSLVRVGPRKAAFYGICAVIAVLLIMKNIGFIIFAGVILGGLYWWLFSGDEKPEKATAGEDEDDDD